VHDSRQAIGRPLILEADVAANSLLCTEHYCLALTVPGFPPAKPGQFVHLCPSPGSAQGLETPFLRRAFSIAGLRRSPGNVEIDVIYRVVGKGTRWMGSLRPGDRASLLGPQGNAFPIDAVAPEAWLIAGGVGLPPLLWFTESLRQAGKQVIFFYGAQRLDLAALQLDPAVAPSADACTATLSAARLAKIGVPVVLSTDDGSIGFHGHVGQALEAYAAANHRRAGEVVLYTCGPEKMMHFVAQLAAKRQLRAHACVERSMACATGMCQSCVVPVHDRTDSAGWRYRLCCTDGPVFETNEVIWDMPTFLAAH
jgi:dihydroorotate dehydrogenase electron transfer subunit